MLLSQMSMTTFAPCSTNSSFSISRTIFSAIDHESLVHGVLKYCVTALGFRYLPKACYTKVWSIDRDLGLFENTQESKKVEVKGGNEDVGCFAFH